MPRPSTYSPTRKRKDFLNRPDSEKDAFIEEFWKKRDPNPETDINEFKIEYEKRGGPG